MIVCDGVPVAPEDPDIPVLAGNTVVPEGTEDATVCDGVVILVPIDVGPEGLTVVVTGDGPVVCPDGPIIHTVNMIRYNKCFQDKSYGLVPYCLFYHSMKNIKVYL